MVSLTYECQMRVEPATGSTHKSQMWVELINSSTLDLQVAVERKTRFTGDTVRRVEL